METVKLAKSTIYNEKEASKYLGIGQQTLRKAIRYKGKITFLRVAGSIKYRQYDLDSYLAKIRVEAVN